METLISRIGRAYLVGRAYLADRIWACIGSREDYLTHLDRCAVRIIEQAQTHQRAGSLSVDLDAMASAERDARAARVFLATGDSKAAWRQLDQAAMSLEHAYGVVI